MNKMLAGIALAAALLTGLVLLFNDRPKDVGALSSAHQSTTVAVILIGPRDDGGWSESHYTAFESIRDELNLDMLYMENVPDGPACIPYLREAVERGAKIIFATSFGFEAGVDAVSEQYPSVYFYHCTGVKTGANVATYMGRMYQMRYLSGLAAGMQTESGHLGYVAAMPIHEVVRGINAFTLGARAANPGVTVHVAWTGEWMNPEQEKKATERLLDNHPVDVIAYHQDSDQVMQVGAARGVASIGYHSDMAGRFPLTCLTSLVWNWAPYYRGATLAALDGRFDGRRRWEGAASGIVDLTPLAAFSKPGIAAVLAREKELLVSGDKDVFDGPLYDGNGVLRVEEGTVMSDDRLLNEFDWFVPGVALD